MRGNHKDYNDDSTLALMLRILFQSTSFCAPSGNVPEVLRVKGRSGHNPGKECACSSRSQCHVQPLCEKPTAVGKISSDYSTDYFCYLVFCGNK